MSINSITFVLLYLFSGFSLTETTKAFTLTINIDGLESNAGQIICNIHNEESSFPKKYLFRKQALIVNKKSKVIFTGLESGEYAVTVIYDKNSNDKMDFNLLHIPSEKTGASNNAKGFFGPPKFIDAKFLIDKNTIISINLN